jgi:hypothetical protein
MISTRTAGCDGYRKAFRTSSEREVSVQFLDFACPQLDANFHTNTL